MTSEGQIFYEVAWASIGIIQLVGILSDNHLGGSACCCFRHETSSQGRLGEIDSSQQVLGGIAATMILDLDPAMDIDRSGLINAT